MLYLAKREYAFRPLTVNLDNDWSSEIVIQNIKNVTKALDNHLETVVIVYDEVKVVLRAYKKALLPWIDGPTDNAIRAVLFKVAEKGRNKIRFEWQ